MLNRLFKWKTKNAKKILKLQNLVYLEKRVWKPISKI